MWIHIWLKRRIIDWLILAPSIFLTHTEVFHTYAFGDCQLGGKAFHSISRTAPSAWQTTTCTTWAGPLCALLIALVPVLGVRTVPYCSHCCCLFAHSAGRWGFATWGFSWRWREGGLHHLRRSYRSLWKQAPHLLVPVRNSAGCLFFLHLLLTWIPKYTVEVFVPRSCIIKTI